VHAQDVEQPGPCRDDQLVPQALQLLQRLPLPDGGEVAIVGPAKSASIRTKNTATPGTTDRYDTKIGTS